MYHRTRWTPEKIKQRLELITPLAYRRQKALPSFRYHELNGPRALPPLGGDVDDSGWLEISADEYWGPWMQDFVLRTTFTIPDEWDRAGPVALYLPLGDAGDFSHPEALAYIDGKPYATQTELRSQVCLGNESARGKRIRIERGKRFDPFEFKALSNHDHPIEGGHMELKIFIEQEDINLIGHRQIRNAIRRQADM